MQEDFVPKKESLALKELGFDELCLGYYLKNSRELKLGEGYDLVTREFRCNVMRYSLHNSNFEYGKNKPEFSYLLTTAPLYQQAFRWFEKKYKFYNHVRPFWHFVVVTGYTFSVNEYTSAVFKSRKKAELECLKYLIKKSKK